MGRFTPPTGRLKPAREAVPAGQHPIDFFVKRKLAESKLQPTRRQPGRSSPQNVPGFGGTASFAPTANAFLKRIREIGHALIIELAESFVLAAIRRARWARLWLDVACASPIATALKKISCARCGPACLGDSGLQQ
jgi:hypothetical protein